jgi:threonine dehydratase
MTPVTVQDIFAARHRLHGRIRRTPLVPSAWLSEVTGAEVWLKLESLQVSNAFKVRGAFNAIAHLLETSDTPPIYENRKEGTVPPTIVTASAGNHGQALAWAARESGLAAVVFTPRDAAQTKLDAIRRWGADLRPIAADYDEAERFALEFAAREGAVFISPYNHPDIVAGGGTVGLEIVEDLPRVDVVAAPVGGGGLISGIATVVDALAPSARVVGVEAAVNPAFRVALDRGRVTEIPVFPTIADGLGGNVVADTITFDIIRRRVDVVTMVTEEEMRDGIRDLLAREHLVAEGAGIAAVGALIAGRVARPGERVAVVVSGANIDLARLRTALCQGA